MDYLNKIRGNASKAAQQLISTVQNQTKLPNIVDNTITKQLTSNNLISNDYNTNTKTNNPNDVKLQEKLLLEFHSICDIIDKLADSENALSNTADKSLHDSSIKNHLRSIILLLLNESNSWLDKYSSLPDPEMSLLPCLDTFIQTNVLQELCNRATRDLPRGTMPLLTTAIANLLKTVRYPLLPHQTIHKPVAHLISVVCRFEALFDMDKHLNYNKNSDILNYKKRIDASLTSLLMIVWRKLSENPPLLDFFIVKDSKPLKDTSLLFQPQFDVLTALMTLIHSPKVGIYASETLLLAVSMHDIRIDSYIIYYTSFIDDLIDELIYYYELLLDQISSKSMSNSFTINPLVTMHNLAYQTTNKLTNILDKEKDKNSNKLLDRHIDKDKRVSINSTNVNVYEKFIKSLLLLNSFVNCASNESSSNIYLLSDSTNNLTEDDINYQSNESLKEILLNKFYSKFLINTLQSNLLSNSESTIISNSFIVRNIIKRLSNIVNNQSNDLLNLILKYLYNISTYLSNYSTKNVTTSESITSVDNNFIGKVNFIETIISHCISISKDVSISSMNLLIGLLQYSSLYHCYYLLNILSNNSTASTNNANSSVNNHSYKYNKQVDNRFRLIYNNKSVLLSTNISIDSQISLVIDCINNLSLDYIPTNTTTTTTNTTSNVTTSTIWGVTSNKMKSLIDIATNNILNHISNKVNSNSDEIDNDLIKYNQITKNNLIVYLLYNKINNMLSQKFDEQIITSAYIISVVSVLASYISIYPSNVIHKSCTNEVNTDDDNDNVYLINVLIEILIAIDKLWIQLNIEYLSKISNIKTLNQATTYIFSNIYLSNHNSNSSIDSNYYKLLDKEKPQVRRILETAVIIQSLHYEIQSYLHAIRSVRKILNNNQSESVSEDFTSNNDENTSSSVRWLIDHIEITNSTNTYEEFLNKDCDTYEIEIDNEYISQFKSSLMNNNNSQDDLNENDFNVEYEALTNYLDEIMKN